MHERLFTKMNFKLNTCKNGVETVRLLRSMNKNQYFKENKVILIMDQKLEMETGVEVIKQVNNYFHLYPDMQLEFVALTSTEDSAVSDAFQSVGTKKI